MRRRAKTVDRDMCVTVTVNESSEKVSNNNYYRYKYLHSNSNDRVTLNSSEGNKTLRPYGERKGSGNKNDLRNNNANEDHETSTTRATNRSYRRTLSRETAKSTYNREIKAKSEAPNLNEVSNANNNRGYFVQTVNSFTSAADEPVHISHVLGTDENRRSATSKCPPCNCRCKLENGCNLTRK